MRAVSERQCIPTLGGGLRHPTRVRLHPEGLTPDELAIWASACPDPDNWTSHAVMSNEHRSKVTRLMGYHDAGGSHASRVDRAPGEGADGRGIGCCGQARGRALRASSGCSARSSRERGSCCSDDGSVDGCRRGQVFLPGGGDQNDRLTIDPVLAADPGVVSALGSLGIEIFDSAGELRSELTQDPIRWERVWGASRKNSIDEAEAIFRDVLGDRLFDRLRVRTYSGKWKGPGGVFLSGEVIPVDGSRDGDFLVDPRFHQQDRDLLTRLGLVSTPRRLASPPMEPWREARLDDVRDKFRKPGGTTEAGRTRRLTSTRGGCSGRWMALSRLSDAGRCALTEAGDAQLDG